jgi:hypothetical protein
MELTTLEPGYNPELTSCPHCGCSKSDLLTEIATEIIHTANVVPVAAQRTHNLLAQLHILECAMCGGDSFTIKLSTVNKRDASFNKITKHYCRQRTADEQPLPFTITYRGKDIAIPYQWLVTKVKTPQGALWRHFYGRYVLQTDTFNGSWLSFTDDQLMGLEPFGLISKVWPLVSLLPG